MTSPLTRGKTLKGVSILPYKFQAVTSLNQIEDYGLTRPTRVQRASHKVRKEDRTLDQAWIMREEVQRRFDAPRSRRAEVYSAYIEQVEVRNEIGGTPAITLWTPTTLSETDDGLEIPYSHTLVAVDGETQTEARFMLADRTPETADNPIAVTIYHGTTLDHARQILHDYNRYAKPISEGKVAAFNSTGPLSQAVDKAITGAGLQEGDVNVIGGKGTKKFVCGYQQIMAAVAGHAMPGIAITKQATSLYPELNLPTSDQVLANGAVSVATKVVQQARNNQLIGQAPTMVWQVAGVVCANGKEPGTLNWAAALQKYKETARGAQGGPRMKVAERLAAIAAVI